MKGEGSKWLSSPFAEKIYWGDVHMPELELNPQKIYKMPTPIIVESVDSYYLVIARETANWILLRNKRQLEIFNTLSSGKSVLDLFNLFSTEVYEDIYAVLVELEAKQFENTVTQHPQEHGMYMYLTNRCNQTCRHCYMYAGKANASELSTEEIHDVLKSFSKSGGKVVTFTGGEATLHPGFVSIVSAAKKMGLKVGVLSNGLLWTQNLIDDVKNSIDEVQISIDGFDADSYKQVRGVDTFELALSSVDRLINAGIRVSVAVTPLVETLIEHESKYIAFAKGLLEKYSEKEFFVKFNTELMEGRNVSPTEEENKKYRKVANRIKTECSPFSSEEGFALDHVNNTVFNNCGYGGLSIASNGDVYFCNLILQCSRQGNVRTDSFESILSKSSKARSLSDVNNLIPCKDCALKYLCGGGCRVKNFKNLVEIKINEQENGHFVREVPCTKEQKEKIYRLMIASNHLFYR